MDSDGRSEINYTFGDTAEASARLRSLALYETETRELLQFAGGRTIDLSCGPGWSTRILKEVLNPDQTVGLDSSQRYMRFLVRELVPFT